MRREIEKKKNIYVYIYKYIYIYINGERKINRFMIFIIEQ